MSLTDRLLRPLLSQPARPLITHYDDAAGTRVELSVATMANWAAKTANWLVDEFDVEPGDEVAVLLPAHWQTAGVLLGAWWCGAHVVAEPAGARVAFVAPDGTSGTAAGSTAVAVVALDPLGRGLASAPPQGALDYLAEARLSGDQFSPLSPIGGGTPALASSTVDDLVERARERATELGIAAGDRVLSTLEWSIPGGLVDGLLAPLVAGANLVQVTNADPAKLTDRRRAERTTVDLLA
ncbi:TIGR03089 family protein [Amycolatopsis cynarae]|uniref:TIGR03089 family protein n=1 Tax=Amycolatopsis cynarae TaxID=2995223 RepID=A0ABY7AYY0_9PSEU|nr:TIGR03089 family protein [Amycolatopsis sp. HUAS 11-8]WAL64917.1 TIGR03089 family protein [Amycolatopsis sp. HUAS 11-8]